MQARQSGKTGAFDRAVRVVVVALGTLSAVTVLTLLLTIVIDVILRVSVNRPIGNIVELSEYWYMILIVYGGIAYAQRKSEHIDVNLMFDRFNEKSRNTFIMISSVLTVATLMLIIYSGWDAAMLSFAIRESAPASDLVIWPARFVLILGSMTFALEVIRQWVTGELFAAHDKEDEDAATSVV